MPAGTKPGRAIPICFNATSSLIAGGGAYGVAVYLLRRDDPRLKWSAVALMGVTAMQWVEGVLWLDGPTSDGFVNRVLTVGLIPLALLAQAWGPLLGSTFALPVRRPPPAILPVAARWIGDGGRGSRHLSTILHAGHATGTPQLVVAAQSACFFALGVWTLGGSDRRSVFVVVASLLASPADCVVGLAVGHREFHSHRQRRQPLVFLCRVLCRLRPRLLIQKMTDEPKPDASKRTAESRTFVDT